MKQMKLVWKSLIVFSIVFMTACQKEDIKEDCIEYFQITIEKENGDTYTYQDFDGILMYGDVTESGIVIERLPFNTCPDKQPYL